MKIYISIPISGIPQHKVREKADLIKSALSRQGHEVINPLDICAGQNPSYDDYICADLRAMLNCDAVYFCDGWEQSCGCSIEHDVVMRYIAHNRKNFVLMYEN